MNAAMLVLASALALSAAPASSGPTVARGKALFESKTLGTNGKSCALCHAGGRGLEEVAETADPGLATYVNSCIQGMLSGKPLPVGSDDLRSLMLYVRSLAPRGK